MFSFMAFCLEVPARLLFHFRKTLAQNGAAQHYVFRLARGLSKQTHSTIDEVNEIQKQKKNETKKII